MERQKTRVAKKSHMMPIIGLLMAHVKALNPTAIKASEDASESAIRTIGRTTASRTGNSQLNHGGNVCDGGINNTWRLHVAQVREMIPDHYLRKQF